MSEMPREVTVKVEMAVEAMAEMVTDTEVTDVGVMDTEEVKAKVATTTITVLVVIGNPVTVIGIRISLKVSFLVID